ncbi:MAG: protease I [Bradymonadia bacterium]|jgi:protease I
MKRVLIPLPTQGFDPTEAAVPWRLLSSHGYKIVFATPDGALATADPIMVTGAGLGPLKYVLRADANGRAAYTEMIASPAFAKTITYEEAEEIEFDGLILPGGHDKAVRPYLESEALQTLAAHFMAADKPVAAICHGVLILARAKQADGRSVLHGRRVTSLVNRLEMTGYHLTRLWMGDYYRTYPGLTTEDEVRACLASDTDFDRGPGGTARDTIDATHRGFVVRDGNLLTARWPGDVHRWSVEFEGLLRGE